MNRYEFCGSESAVKSLQRRLEPLWRRYEEHAYENVSEYPLAIHFLDAWCNIFGNLLPVLREITGISSSVQEVEAKIYGLHAAFQVLYRDLRDIQSFAAGSLSHDPWILERVQELMSEHPELFEGEDENDTEPDEPVVAVNEALLPEEIPPLA